MFKAFFILLILILPLLVKAEVQIISAQKNYVNGLDFPIEVLNTGDETINIHWFRCPGRTAKIETILHSWAKFKPVFGSVSLSQQAPLEGTYLGIDKAGLFWSASQLSVKKPLFKALYNSVSIKSCDTPIILIEKLGKVLAIKHIQWPKTIDFADFGMQLTRFTMERHGFRGYIVKALAPNSQSKSGLLLLGGTSSAPSQVDLMELLRYALKGYIVIGLEYYGHDVQPKCPANIELNQFILALKKLNSYKAVSNIAIIGVSGGASAATLAAYYSEIKPNALILQSFNPFLTSAYLTGSECGLIETSPWQINGNPLPYLSTTFTYLLHTGFGMKDWFSDKPYVQVEMLNKAFKNLSNKQKERYQLPLNKLNLPILMIGGKLDKLTPTAMAVEYYCEQIGCDKTDNKAIIYENSGHFINMYAEPFDSCENVSNSSDLELCYANGAASSRTEQETLLFLKKNLR